MVELPAEAVEAAAKALCEADHDAGWVWDRALATASFKAAYRDQARSALTAALPFIAEAFANEIGAMCTYRERDGQPLPAPHPADHLGPCPFGKVVERILSP